MNAPAARSMPVSSAPNAAQSVRQERRSIAAISAAGNLPTRRTRRNSAPSAAIHSMRGIRHNACPSAQKSRQQGAAKNSTDIM